MKYNNYFFLIIYCVITTFTFTYNAMEKNLIFNDQKKAIKIIGPLCVQYITNDTIAIINKNKRSYILDLKTKKEQTINHSPVFSNYKYTIILSKNNKIMTYNEGTISIYDITTKKCIKKEPIHERFLAWDSSNNTIFFAI